MKKNDKLFDLVKAMNMSEKRYFKLFATKTHDNQQTNYIHLFDVLDCQQHYDERKLIAHLKKKNVKTTFLSADKNYLYKLILKSLRAFNAGKSIKLTIKENLEYVEILYYKGLHQQALKWLQKSKKMALQYDLPIQAIEIMQWERKISGYDLKADKVAKGFEELNKQIAILVNANQYSALYYESMLLRKAENKARDTKSICKFNQLLKNELLQNEDLGLSKYAQIGYFDIYANYYFLINNIQQEYVCNKKIIQIIESDKKFMKENIIDYILIYSRLLRLQRKQDDETFKINLEKFEHIATQIAPNRLEAKMLNKVLFYSLKMVDWITKGNFEEAVVFIETVEHFLNNHANYIRAEFKITAYYRFVYIYIATQKYPEALHYANKITNEFDEKIKPDVYRFTKVLQILIHYEMNNFYLLKYLIRSTQQYLKKQKRLYKMEHTFLKFAQKLPSLKSKQKEKEALQQLYTDIEQLITQDEFEKQALYYFDFISWLDSKTTNISFQDSKRKKYYLKTYQN